VEWELWASAVRGRPNVHPKRPRKTLFHVALYTYKQALLPALVKVQSRGQPCKMHEPSLICKVTLWRQHRQRCPGSAHPGSSVRICCIPEGSQAVVDTFHRLKRAAKDGALIPAVCHGLPVSGSRGHSVRHPGLACPVQQHNPCFADHCTHCLLGGWLLD